MGRLVNMMEHLEYTERELAEELGISRASINSYCRGFARPGKRAMAKLCDALGCEPEFLFPEEGTI